MKKLYFVMALLALVALLAPVTAQAQDAPDCTKPEVFCVGMVTDVGKVDDKSFNQSCWEGLQLAKENGDADWIQYIETTDSKDYAKNMATFADAGYDVVVTSGFNLTEATYAAAKLYPNVIFLGTDQFLMKDEKHPDLPLPNLVGLVYNEDQSGFLVGYLAATLSKSHKIGAVAGTDAVPPVWRYGEGYKAGAAYADKQNGTTTEVFVVYHNDVGFDKTFTDPEWGKTTASGMIDKGVDAMFGIGGKTGNGAVIEAVARGFYGIGVDVDQYTTLPEAQKGLLTSALKPITAPVADLIKQAKAGTLKGGLFYGAAGYAPYHDKAGDVPAEADAAMQTTLQGLTDGTIKTNVPPVKPVAAPAAQGGGNATTIIIVVVILVIIGVFFVFRRRK
jgi:basic membrane protein A